MMIDFRKTVLGALLFVGLISGFACNGTTSSSADGGTDSSTDTDSDTDSDVECDWGAEFADFFARDHVVQISIDFDDAGSWTQMALEKDTEVYYRATITIDGESMSDVGVRVKGNSSLQMSGPTNTKSLKIHFEEYVDGQRFHCVDRFSLNNATKDPSMMREVLAYDLARDCGLIASRTSFAELTVDGALHGVFTMVQQVDHRFLKDNYGTEDSADDGNLYKLYSDYDFSYLGSSAGPDSYGDSDAETGLVLKTNEDDETMNTFEDITLLTKAIHDVLNDPNETNRAALEEVMDIDSYLSFQAWTLVISNLDAYYSMKHNLYIYHNPVTDKFETIPWDNNEAYGSFPCMGGGPSDPPDEDVFSVDLLRPCGAEAPLNRLSYEVPEYNQRYCEFLENMVDVNNTSSGGLYNVDDQDARMVEFHALIGEARQHMDSDGTLTQPPGDYTYADYLTNQGHTSTPIDGGGGPGPAAGPNLGYFNDTRLTNLIGLISLACN